MRNTCKLVQYTVHKKCFGKYLCYYSVLISIDGKALDSGNGGEILENKARKHEEDKQGNNYI